MPISEEQLEIVSTPSSWSVFLLHEFNKTITGTDNDICEALSSAPDASDIFVENGQTLQFIINFDDPQFINTLSIYYVSGTGQLTIHVQEDCCPSQWVLINNVFLDGGHSEWIDLRNQLFNKKRVQRIRFTVVGLPETGVNLNRFYLCTSPAPDICPEDGLTGLEGEGQGTALTIIENAFADQIDTRSATLRWSPSIQAKEGIAEPVANYWVQYSILRDENGDLIQPHSVHFQGNEWGNDHDLHLNQLAPATTYQVDIVPDVETIPCPHPPVGGDGVVKKLSFETLLETLEGPENRSNGFQNKAIRAASLVVSPNPTKDILSFETSEIGFSNFRVVHVSGVQMLEDGLDINSQFYSLKLSDVPPGVYILSVFGEGKKTVSKAFLVGD